VADNNDFGEKEVKEMEGLIISLSLEPTDESRRERLHSIFDEALARPNGRPEQFSDLFDQALVTVGEEVKAEAQKAALESQETASLPEEQSEDTDQDEASSSSTEKSPQQRQLWALVDMMVQSKTIVKKHSGELGNRGTFQ
jgi:hypothetical protein